MEKQTVDVLIPSYHPGEEFGELLRRLENQTTKPDRIIVMNTEEAYWNPRWEQEFSTMEVHHITRASFDHGGTRRAATKFSDSDIMVFMTQDALPADEHLIGNLIRPLREMEGVGAAYARQLPRENCRFLEKYTRSFNYPEESGVKFQKDVERCGIKTYFCSNVCAAYDRKIYDQLEGFVDRAIFNEDMIYAGNLIQKGYGVAYAADARVYHSHNYSGLQQFHRNFDLGVSQAEHPEIFEAVSSEKEGIALVKKSYDYLVKTRHFHLIPQLIIQSGCKYLGYRLGRDYRKLPRWLCSWCSMSPVYWKRRK